MAHQEVRVRYAPSPTGLQHIGGVRTALFNYLFARSQSAQTTASFILRIEDTDRMRSKDRYIQDLYESLRWLGIHPDEGPAKYGFPGGDYGPYIQSERIDLYRSCAQQLLAQGKAYYCFCSTERLEKLRREQEKSKSPLLGYDRHCRSLDPVAAGERARRIQDAQNHQGATRETCVVRFAIPLKGSTPFCDLLLGNIVRSNADINPDPVLLKADGFPTYHLANVIDDHHMKISHILRAQEWLSSGPLHMLLYQAFGWEAPLFCHLPMVMGRDGSKLSKRHGSTSLLEFRKAGYLPEAITNYIALLGWAYDDRREFFHLNELEQSFSLEKLSCSSATFDYQKLDWFNAQYLRQRSIAELKADLIPIWQDSDLAKIVPNSLDSSSSSWDCWDWILPLLQERLKLLSDAPAMAAYFFVRPDYQDPILPKKHSPDQAIKVLQCGRQVVKQLLSRPDSKNWEDFTAVMLLKQVWEAAFRQAAAAAGLKMGILMQPLRFAITGSNASPPLIESMIILEHLSRDLDSKLADEPDEFVGKFTGKSELLERIDALAQRFAELRE